MNTSVNMTTSDLKTGKEQISETLSMSTLDSVHCPSYIGIKCVGNKPAATGRCVRVNHVSPVNALDKMYSVLPSLFSGVPHTGTQQKR
jgi:hypothetical protein